MCYARCEPPCHGDEGCVDGACVDQTGGCEAPANACADSLVSCPDIGPGYSCVLTNTGHRFCAWAIDCKADGSDLCQSDADCRTNGLGPNARCIFDCSTCDGGNACAISHLDF